METTVFKQKAKIGVAGSFQNQLMSNNSTVPVVGMGATKLHYSDRTCYEVIEVSKDGKRVTVESLNAIADKSKKCDMGHQNWILEPSGYFTTIVWRHNTWKIEYQEIVFSESFLLEYNSMPRSNERYSEMVKPLFDDEGNLMLVDGKTEQKTKYSKINILWGVKDYHYDWEF